MNRATATIKAFVDVYSTPENREQFILDLWEIMNWYALNAIKHGGLPEKGSTHGSAKP